jgi:hypothetical protein
MPYMKASLNASEIGVHFDSLKPDFLIDESDIEEASESSANASILVFEGPVSKTTKKTEIGLSGGVGQHQSQAVREC